MRSLLDCMDSVQVAVQVVGPSRSAGHSLKRRRGLLEAPGVYISSLTGRVRGVLKKGMHMGIFLGSHLI